MAQGKAWLPLVTFFLSFTFPAWSEIYPDDNPQVLVSVYDDVGVSASVLLRAEREAAKIFSRARVQVLWANCTSHVGQDALVRAGEQSSPGFIAPKAAELRSAGRVGAPAPTWIAVEAGCSRFDWPSHLAIRIVPKSMISVNEVFGVAFLSAEGTGCYSSVYYDRALGLHNDWNVSLADILGNVMAHELGHLLLGSNAHAPAGIMKARWQGEELGRVGRGNLLFTEEQGVHMRGKLNAVRQPLAVAAQSSLGSSQ